MEKEGEEGVKMVRMGGGGGEGEEGSTSYFNVARNNMKKLGVKIN